MNILRFYNNLNTYIEKNKVLVIYGPRRIGKTTLLNNYLKKTKYKYKLDNGDDLEVQDILSSQNIRKIQEYAQNYDLIVIDEAQKIPQIGTGLKILIDHVKNIKVIATGSASFDLSQKIGEPLTGRKNTLLMYPVAQLELQNHFNNYELKQDFDDYVIFGSYPEVLIKKDKKDKIKYLKEIVNSYLLKDILELENLKGSKKLLDLLRLLAYQVGSEVSYLELGTQIGLNDKTIAKYLDLFEKTFIIFRLDGFSRNLRKEITKKSKYYFFDLGIRNMLIANLNPIKIRNDLGQLFENFMIMERLKKQNYQEILTNNYFWRTWDKKEIDFIEEKEGKLKGYEFKFNPKKQVKAPKDWINNYKNSSFDVINKDNYLDFIL